MNQPAAAVAVVAAAPSKLTGTSDGWTAWLPRYSSPRRAPDSAPYHRGLGGRGGDGGGGGPCRSRSPGMPRNASAACGLGAARCSAADRRTSSPTPSSEAMAKQAWAAACGSTAGSSSAADRRTSSPTPSSQAMARSASAAARGWCAASCSAVAMRCSSQSWSMASWLSVRTVSLPGSAGSALLDVFEDFLHLVELIAQVRELHVDLGELQVGVLLGGDRHF